MNRDFFFTKNLLAWYKAHQRSLPWRQTTDPYKIWLSEIILQQTRVNQGLPYYERIVASFPTVFDLAQAEEKDVLRHWQGLGYYSRARNLHACAKMVAFELGGTFPTNFKELLLLKGVGKYTAAAIASLAFNEPVPVVDGNVMRLLSRYFGIDEDIQKAKTWQLFFDLAALQMADSPPPLYNQALMEFGALQCKPQSPFCNECPLQSGCKAFKMNSVDRLPFKGKKTMVKEFFLNYLVVQQGQQFWMHERNTGGVWKGLYQFMLHESSEENHINDAYIGNLLAPLPSFELLHVSESIKHQLSHRTYRVRFIHLLVDQQTIVPKPFIAYTKPEMHQLPKPILIDNYLQEYIF